MTKFIHKNEVLLKTNHTSPHEIEIDEYDIDTSNWFFLKNNIKIYDRMEGVHQKDNVEFVLVEDSKTDEKIRTLVEANLQNMVPWAPVVRKPSNHRHQIIVHDNVLLPKDWFLEIYHEIKTAKQKIKIIAKDLAEVTILQDIKQANKWMDEFNKCFPFNNERLFNTFIDQTKEPIDTFIGVASGFKPFLFLKNIGYTPNTKMYLFDTNKDILELKKWTYEEWDGEKDSYIERIQGVDCVKQNYNKMWSRDFSMFGYDMKADLAEMFFYIKPKLINDSITNFKDYVKPVGKTVIWWDGVFKYPPYFYNKTKKHIDNEFNKFLQGIEKMDKNCICYGNDPWKYSYNNVKIDVLRSRLYK